MALLLGNIKKSVVRFFFIVAGGVFGAFAFPSVLSYGPPSSSIWYFAFLSLIVLYVALLGAARSSGSIGLRGAGLGALWALPFFAIQIHWAVYPANSVVPWVALTFIQVFALSVHGAIFCLVARHILNSFWLLNIWAGLCWVSVEQLRSHFPFTGFPWSKLAFSQVDGPFLGLAPWAGSVGVAMVLVIICNSVAQFLLSIFTYSSSSYSFQSNNFAVGSIAIFYGFRQYSGLFMRLFGIFLVSFLFSRIPAPSFPSSFFNNAQGSLNVHESKQERTLHVLAVQGNVVSEDVKNAFGKKGQVMGFHRDETLRAWREELVNKKDSIELILWPESAADMDPRFSSAGEDMVEQVNTVTGLPLLFGTLRVENGKPVNKVFNEMVFFDGKAYSPVYTKAHPVPFGEYLPWRSFFTRIYPPTKDLIPLDMQAGLGPAVLKLKLPGNKKTISVASPICFEVADDSLVSRAIFNGGEALFFPSSNTFFLRSAQGAQQLAIARFRAAEHGRFAIAISTMAHSAPIDDSGNLLKPPTDLFETASFTVNLPLKKQLTLATVIDPYLPMTCWGCSVFMIVVIWFCAKRRKKDYLKSQGYICVR